MKKTRESLMFWGAFVLLIGLTFRCFDSVELNSQATKLAAKYTGQAMQNAMLWSAPDATTRISIPTWLGWGTLCISGVLIFEGLLAPKGG
jgi:hypothetical protein